MTDAYCRNRVIIWFGTTFLLFLFLPAINLYNETVTLEEVETVEDLFQTDVLERYRNEFLYELGYSGDKGQVVVGKQQWLFLGDDYENNMARGRGIRNISPARIDEWVRSMEARQRWLASQGIGLVFAIAPNKHSVYPEYLPEGVTIASPNSTDRLVATMQQAGIRTIDGRKLLLHEKERWEYLYNKTDTHWSSIGAYLVYKKIMLEVRAEASELNQSIDLPLSGFKQTRTNPSGLARLLKIRRYLGPKSDFGYSPPKHSGVADKLCLEVFTSYSIPRTECKPSANRVLPVFSTKYVVNNEQGVNDGTVLLIRDSFGNATSTLMNSTFTKSVQVHHRHTASEVNFKKIIQMETPKVVIYIVAERSLFSRSFYSFR